MDRTLLNVISLILGGAGLLTVLTGFNVPQTRMAYFGENPYQIKRDMIGGVMATLFTVVALSGLAIQVLAEVFGDALPSRLHSRNYYMLSGLISLVGAAVLIALLTRLGNAIARRRWLPQVLASQGERIDRVVFAFAHDGLPPEHEREREKMTPAALAKAQESGWSAIDTALVEIEHLLELPSLPERGSRVKRLERLRVQAAA